jgi:hypothetical protein
MCKALGSTSSTAKQKTRARGQEVVAICFHKALWQRLVFTFFLFLVVLGFARQVLYCLSHAPTWFLYF